MKRSKILCKTLVGFSMLLAISAFAANKGSLLIESPLNVAGTRLPAGWYIVQWEGMGPTAELKIMQDNKVMATAHATVTHLQEASVNDAVVISVYRDGSRHLLQIFFSGKNFELVIQDESMSGRLNARN